MNQGKSLVSLVLFLLAAADAHTQMAVIPADAVRSWMTGSRKVLLIDTRRPDEYKAGHIPGAVNIPPERMKSQAAQLPKDKTMPIIFYCRGAG